MASNLDLVIAAFEAIFGVDLSDNQENQESEETRVISISDFFEETYYMRPILGKSYKKPVNGLQLYVMLLTGKTVAISYDVHDKIEEVKQKVEDRSGIPVCEQIFLFAGKQLEDDITVSEYNIQPGATFHLNVRLRGGGGPCRKPQYKLDTSKLDPSFDFDFSDMTDDGEKYMRGGFEYQRPYGWNRVAIKVTGKYESDDWLGPNGIRTSEAPNEWPVYRTMGRNIRI